MSRREKSNSAEAHYLLTLRTAQKVHWMKEPEVKKKFLDLLEFFSKVYYVKVLALNFMDNHWHIVLQVNKPKYDIKDVERRYELAQSRTVQPKKFDEWLGEKWYKRYTDLSEFMWSFNRGTALAYNKEKGTSGHFWGRRYHSEEITDSEGLLNAISYTEMNGVRAGKVETPMEQEYSSAGQLKRALAAGKKRSVAPIGFLAKATEADRPLAYLIWLGEVARRYHNPETRNQPSPPELRRLLGSEEAVGEQTEKQAKHKCEPVYGLPEARRPGHSGPKRGKPTVTRRARCDLTKPG